ncbi:MAG: hypothetical protein K6G82_06670 [Ruminococcus sp.]|nr:hypothetical protein [Ruminococcus sp.]
MKTLKFMGYSDDTFGEYGVTNEDVDNCGSGNPIQCVINAEGTQLVVTGQYGRYKHASWDIGITPPDEELPMPEWAIRVRFEEYTTVVEIDVPDEFELDWYNDGERVEGY